MLDRPTMDASDVDAIIFGEGIEEKRGKGRRERDRREEGEGSGRRKGREREE